MNESRNTMTPREVARYRAAFGRLGRFPARPAGYPERPMTAVEQRARQRALAAIDAGAQR